MRSFTRTSRAALLATLTAALGAASLAPVPAAAHPLGNFSVNHISFVSISQDGVAVRYVLDQAEIPTFQERGEPLSSVLAAKRAAVVGGLALRVDGRPIALTLTDAGRIALRPGQGGLRTTRVELRLHAAVRQPRRVEFEDRTFAGRVGWRDIVVVAGSGTAVRSSVPASEPTRELRVYPRSLLTQPADRRRATFTVTAGSGTVQAPGAGSAVAATSGGARDDARDGFAGLFEDAAAGQGVLLALALAAFGWGALHALSPGHGKAMVAAYLVGARGTARDALLLGLTVTVTHTIGVFALGLVALSLSAYVLPEDLYPWLNLVAGVMVLAVGAGVLRARLRERRAGHAGPHTHHHHHHHHHGHGDHHHHHPHDEAHHHGEHAQRRLSTKGLAALGASAGLIPCPSALVVLLGAVSQHEIALGMGLIVAFSLGLAATLTALGLAVVWTAGFAGRLPRSGRLLTAARTLPLVSALVIVGIGALFTAQAVPAIV